MSDRSSSGSTSGSNPDLLALLLDSNTEDVPKKNEDEEEAALSLQECSRLSLSPTSVTTTAPDHVPPLLRIQPDDELPADTTASTTTASDCTISAAASTAPAAAWPLLPASRKSWRTTNPIRAIVDPVLASVNSDTLSLALGDPTAYLEPCPVAMAAVRDALLPTAQGSSHGSASLHYCAGYVNACGTDAARRAIAAHPHYAGCHADQVIVANGCSGALELALTALLDTETETSILLVPQPGFPLYQVIAESHGATVVHYRLLPHQNWEMDLDHVREILQQYAADADNSSTTTSQVQPRVIRGLVVNNPSNPTGAVYSRQHLRDICSLCDEYHIPIVADEVYGDLVLDGHTFHPLAQVAAALGRRVPVITASGIGKQYLLPGWRVGWIVFHDK